MATTANWSEIKLIHVEAVEKEKERKWLKSRKEEINTGLLLVGELTEVHLIESSHFYPFKFIDVFSLCALLLFVN